MPFEKVMAEIKKSLSRPYSRLSLALLVAVLCTVVTAIDIAPETGGPGVTCDEFYHVSYGKRLVASILANGLGFFRPHCICNTFDWRKDGPPVHPPLGNWILGWANWLFDPKPLDLLPTAIAPARLGTAVCFGCLAFIVGLFCIRQYGLLGGMSAAFSLICMPRLFGHAHLAALDLITALTCTSTIVAIIWAGEDKERYRFLLAGVVWGLALLTRFHALLCFPPILCYMICRLRQKAVLPLIVWSATGIVTFFLGWPWLWLDPLGHLQQYLVSSTQRIHIHTFYLGRVWNDVAVPWHYPWVMFLITVPIGILFLGVLGISTLCTKRRSCLNSGNDPSEQAFASWLVVGTICVFLLVFSVPGVPVYDGVRLFLPAYPLWAILVGRGTQAFWQILKSFLRESHVLRTSIVCVFLALQATGVLWFRPIWLSYYNCLVGGLWGAEKLGFEINYWGDALTEQILCDAASRIPEGETLFFAPSLAPYQGAGIVVGSPCLIEHGIPLQAWSTEMDESAEKTRWVLIYRRRADMPEHFSGRPNPEPVSEVSRQGVWLARLVQITPLAGPPGSPAGASERLKHKS